MTMRLWTAARLMLVAGVAAALLVPLTASGGTSAGRSTVSAQVQNEADLYQIEQIEVKFHRATSHHDINLMMSIWAPGAVFDIDQETLTGKAQIRHWFLTKNKAFMAGHHWESDTPSYKIKIHLNGDQATMYFECHYIDPRRWSRPRASRTRCRRSTGSG